MHLLFFSCVTGHAREISNRMQYYTHLSSEDFTSHNHIMYNICHIKIRCPSSTVSVEQNQDQNLGLLIECPEVTFKKMIGYKSNIFNRFYLVEKF